MKSQQQHFYKHLCSKSGKGVVRHWHTTCLWNIHNLPYYKTPGAESDIHTERQDSIWREKKKLAWAVPQNAGGRWIFKSGLWWKLKETFACLHDSCSLLIKQWFKMLGYVWVLSRARCHGRSSQGMESKMQQGWLRGRSPWAVHEVQHR